MTADFALLEKALQAAIDNPEAHRQRTWRCESGECYAGLLALVAGGEWASGHPDIPYMLAVPDDPAADEILIEEASRLAYDDSLPIGTRLIHVKHRAIRVAGLTDVEAALLFNGRNTVEDIRRLIDRMAAPDWSDDAALQLLEGAE